MDSACRVKIVLILVTVLFSSLICGQASASRYYSLDDFFKAYPGERHKLESLNRQVKRNSVSAISQQMDLTVAIVYPGEQVSDYWRRSYRSFVNRLAEYGIKPKVYSFFIKPTAVLSEQSEAFRRALATNPDYLVFTLDALRHQRIIEPVLIRSRPRIILQNITTPIKAWDGKQPFMYIGFDHARGAEMLAQYFAAATGGTGEYAVLLPGPGYLSDQRGKTFIDWMDRNTSLEMVSVFRTGIDKDKAYKATLNLLKKYTDIKFIYACSTDIALGAIEALKETGLLGKIKINGWGGGTPELEAVARGEMDVTVMRINDDNGVAMADGIVLDMLGRGELLPLVYSGRFELVEKGIEKVRLELLESQSFRYSDKGVENK